MVVSRGHIHSGLELGGKTYVDDRRNFSKTGLCGQQRKSNLHRWGGRAGKLMFTEYLAHARRCTLTYYFLNLKCYYRYCHFTDEELSAYNEVE